MSFGWKKTQPLKFNCPSGAVVYLKRPGPEMALYMARLPQVFNAPRPEVEPKTDEEIQRLGLERLASMSDEEAEAYVQVARRSVHSCLVSPKLPWESSDPNTLTIQDIPAEDVWEIWKWAQTGGRGLSVGKEVNVEDVETFSEGGAPAPGAWIDSNENEPATIGTPRD